MTITRPPRVAEAIVAIEDVEVGDLWTAWSSLSRSDVSALGGYIRDLERRVEHFEDTVAKPAFEEFVDGFVAGHLRELSPLPELPLILEPPVVVASGRYYGYTRKEILDVATNDFALYLEVDVESLLGTHELEVGEATFTQDDPIWSALVTCYEKEES